MLEYAQEVKKVGRVLFDLLSEALNLKTSHLNDIGCSEGLGILYHYYPPCPEPELTLGASIHTDINFMTVLLQDHLGGLQYLYNDQWVDIPPVSGALVVDIGDLLQASQTLLTTKYIKIIQTINFILFYFNPTSIINKQIRSTLYEYET